MKITIKKFMELSNVTIQTPAKIEAGHDVGKSTIFRAVLFAITGKDIDGKEFDGRIYQKAAKTLSELNIEVEIEQDGIVFNKKATGSEKRQKGSDETELQRSVTSTYSIDYRVVGKAEYDATILEVFGNFHLFSNPDYFRNIRKEDKRAIFSSLIKIDKNSYFDGLSDKKTVSGKIKAQKDQIAATEAKLSELSKVQEPERIDVIDYDSQLAELRKQRQEAAPKFTDEQLTENNELNHKIAQLEKATFVPAPLIPLLPEIEKPKLVDIDVLQRELEKVQLSEPDTYFIDGQILRMESKIKTIKSLILQIENYDENVKNSKCTLCQVCTAPDCQFKRVELTPLDDLQNELSKLMPLEFAEKSLEMLEDEKINFLRSFESKKESEIVRLQNNINKTLDLNAAATVDYSTKKAEHNKKTDEINAANATIKTKNAEGFANFESDRANLISELKSQLHTLPAFDYSEIDEQIKRIEALQENQQTLIDSYNELKGAYNYAAERIKELSKDLQEMKSALYTHERELIKIEAAENSYYSDFESLINSEMPENVRVSLFKKNLSNDDYTEVFDIEFNGSIYAGNGKTIAFYIWLCSWFQAKFEKNLPIFIDEAIILNEKLYSDVKNVVILMRNDECKTLKISEI
jgi:DNA repair exonuclease SbcCD ATPase subunit